MGNQKVIILEDKVKKEEIIEEEEKHKLTDGELKEKFITKLESLMKKAKIKKYKMAEYMKIDKQTFYNWFGKKKEVPNWIIQMYRMNVYLYKQKKLNYNPLMLFNDKFQQLQTQQIESYKEVSKVNMNYMIKMDKNTTLYFGRSKHGSIDFRLLFSNGNLYDLLYDLKLNYCDLPPNERNKGIGKNSVSSMKDRLFEFFTEFIITHKNERGKFKYLMKDGWFE